MHFELEDSVRHEGRNEEGAVGVWGLHSTQRGLEVAEEKRNLWRRRRETRRLLSKEYGYRRFWSERKSACFRLLQVEQLERLLSFI